MKKWMLVLGLVVIAQLSQAEEIIPDGRNSFENLRMNIQSGVFVGGSTYEVYRGYKVDENVVKAGFSLSTNGFGIHGTYASGKDARIKQSFVGYTYRDEMVFQIGVSSFNRESDATGDAFSDLNEAKLLLGYESDYFRFLVDYRSDMSTGSQAGDYVALLSGITLNMDKLDFNLSYLISMINASSRDDKNHHSDLKLEVSYPLENKSLQFTMGSISYLSDESKVTAGEDSISYASLAVVFVF